jgi:hypothetical protein
MSALLAGTVRDGFSGNRCGTPLASDLLAVLLFFPVLLFLTYRAWQTSKITQVGIKVFKGIFILARCLCLAAAIIIAVLACRSF